MEILLIDIGALAVFLGYVAIVYWHAVSQESPPTGWGSAYLGRESARARSARSSVEIDQRSSQLMQ
jgi:hypothetical protein